MKFKKYKLILAFLLIALLFVGLKFSSKPLVAQDSDVSDAIAIRVLPNSEHYGIQTWYQKQGFSGSPQSLVVDGYEAIRDGRTVYVAASNVDSDKNEIYTNIYLISYNQEIETETVDILGQIISNWSFNKNISGEPSYCSISIITCSDDDDCPSGLVCGNDNDSLSFQNNKCVVEEKADKFDKTKKCLTDSECASGFYCSSLKARVTRDVIRLGRLSDIAAYIEDYNYTNGSYPTLRAGSYMPNFSLSVWPSWTNVLASDTGFSSTLVDPINKLGSCVIGNVAYDLETCWSDERSEFYDNNLAALDLPSNSFVFVYKGVSDGSEYNLCANMEAKGYSFGTGSGLPSNSFCMGEMYYGNENGNNVPQLIGYSLQGETGRAFDGEIEVIDLDGEVLSWSITPVIPGSFSSWEGGVAPKLITTHNPNKRILHSDSAGASGDYIVNLVVRDGSGGKLEEELTISITDQGPQIQAEDVDYIFKDDSSILNYSAYIYDDNLLSINHTELYSLIVNYPDDFPEPKEKTAIASGDIGHGLSQEMIKIADNKYELKITGLLGDTDGDGKIDEDSNDLNLGSSDGDVIRFKLSVQDKSPLLGDKDFNINILHDAPIFNIDCPDTLRISNDKYRNNYNCYIELENQTPDTEISFSYKSSDLINGGWSDSEVGLPDNFSFNGSSGLLTGYSKTDKDYKIYVKATNETGVSSQKDFIINVNNYCGDMTQQLPNNEFKGGVYNDGFEQCDHEDGLALSFRDSYDNDKYYKCSTFQNTLFPLPVGSCLFDTDGGKCGDGIVQEDTSMDEGEECDFGLNNLCCNNCQWDLSNAVGTKELPLSFVDEIGLEDEVNEVKLENGMESYLKTPDVIYVDDEGLFDIDILPAYGDVAVEILIEKSLYMDNYHPSYDINGFDRAMLTIFGLNKERELVAEAEDDSLLNLLRIKALGRNISVNVGITFFKFSGKLYPLPVRSDDDYCDIREEACYDRIISIAKDCRLTNGLPNINSAIDYGADKILNSFEYVDNTKQNIVLFGSGRVSGVSPLSALEDIKIGKGINVYTVFSPLSNSYCVNSSYSTNYCKWSSDYGDPYNISSCADNCCSNPYGDSCDERKYSFLSQYYSDGVQFSGPTTGQLSSDIADSLTKSSPAYPSRINVFGESIVVLPPEYGGDVSITDHAFNIYNIDSEFSCSPLSVTCYPDFLTIKPVITGNIGAIKLRNVRVNVLENLDSCEGTPVPPENVSGEETGPEYNE